MTTADINAKIIDGYLDLLRNLSPGSKLDLIAKLSESLKSDVTKRKSLFRKSFGAFQSKKSAEEIIKEIRESRNFNRQLEEF